MGHYSLGILWKVFPYDALATGHTPFGEGRDGYMNMCQSQESFRVELERRHASQCSSITFFDPTTLTTEDEEDGDGRITKRELMR